MPIIKLQVLGGFTLSDNSGGEVAIRSKKSRALLAYLSLHPGRPLSRDMLADLFWGDRPEARARHNLRQALSVLRSQLNRPAPKLLEIDAQSVTCNDSGISVDAVAFEHFAETGDVARAAALYGGELLEGMTIVSTPFEAWLNEKRRYLKALAGDVLEELSRRQMAAGDADAAADAARRAVALDELREPAQRLLITALSGAGRPVEAMRQYRNFSDLLETELGVAPDVETRRLGERLRLGRRVLQGNDAAGPAAATGARGVRDRPSIAVLPFDNLTGDQSQDYFADGICEDIIAALSKSRFFFVTARSATQGYKAVELNVPQIAKELGVRYVVEGSLRAAGAQIRLSLQLIDAQNEHHIWADHYDCERGEIFAVQDAIIERIVAAIAPEYVAAEIYRARRAQERDLTAWDFFMRAYWHLSRFTKSDMQEARRLAREAVERDDQRAGPYTVMAVAHTMEALYDWSGSRDNSLRDALEAALQAVSLDSRDPLANRALAIVHFWSKRFDDALYNIRQAIQLDPYEAENHGLLGQFLGMAGDYDGAQACFDRALELSPRDTFIVAWHNNRAMVAMVARRYEEAAEWARTSLRINPKFPGSYRTLAAATGNLGQMAEAHRALTEFRRLAPSATLSQLRDRLPFLNDQDLEDYLGGLRRAGLSE